MANKNITITTMKFPEIRLQTRDAHKLRGYFGNLFKEHSPLLHNHYETGELRYRYPLVQYKVLNGVPTLVAIKEGAQLLNSLFMKIRSVNIDGEVYPVHSKNILTREVPVGYSEKLIEYRFDTLWMALNQDNFRQFQLADESAKIQKLQNILIGNVLSFFKGIDLRLENEHRLMTIIKPREKTAKFKNNTMLAYDGHFIINALLPQGIGLGKGVSRGFGCISQK